MSDSTKRVVIGEGIALAAWLVVMLACHNVLMSPFVFYASLLFGALAFVASATSLALAEGRAGSRALTETNSLPTVLSCGYLAVALVMNAAFCLASVAWMSTTLPVVLNVVLLAAFVLVRMGMDSHAKTAQGNVAAAVAKVAEGTAACARVGELVAQAEDPAVRKALLDLREKVSLSSNVSGAAARDAEGQFMGELDSIAASMARGEAPEATLELVGRAEKAWRRRNAAMAR